MKKAIVTAAIGQQYLDYYNKNFRTSHERFAERIGAKLFVITSHIDDSEFGHSRHPAWQALLIFRIPELQEYDDILWIDGDIYVRQDAKDPFLERPEEENVWLAAKNNAYDVAHLAKTDPSLFNFCPIENRPAFVLNLGLFITNRKKHQAILEKVYKESPEQPCYYQGPLTYALLNDFEGQVLPPYYNAILASYLDKHGKKLSVILNLISQSGFIHFAGGLKQPYLWLVLKIDTSPRSLSARLVVFFGREWFDHLTSFLIRVIAVVVR